MSANVHPSLAERVCCLQVCRLRDITLLPFAALSVNLCALGGAHPIPRYLLALAILALLRQTGRARRQVEDDKSDSDSPSDEKPVFNRKASLRKSLKPLADMLKADKPKVLITRMIDLTKSP